MLMGERLGYRRLRAPRDDGGVLIEPPLAEAGRLMAENAARRQAPCDLFGRRLADLSAEAVPQLIDAAVAYTREYRDVERPSGVVATRVALAGHQPQLFHPGVWFKNFVLSRIGQQSGAVAVNLIIDSDAAKEATLRVPGGSPESPVAESLPFDAVSEEIPFEERQILDRECLTSFGRRAGQRLRPLVRHPLLDEFWPRVIERSGEQENLGLCLAQARHLEEARFGASTFELPQSEVCDLPAFHWFTAHLLAHLPRLWETYNAAIHEYREVNHVRSRSHPVPDLAIEHPWLEAPYWIWTVAEPRRRRLFVRADGDATVLADRGGLEIRLPLAIDGDPGPAVARLAELAGEGVKLRTRALITTMFARLFLGDMFLHGIGGAKYDEVTDLVIRRFFGVEPPGYMTATATLRLPTGAPAIDPQALEPIDRRLRELEFHPERFLADGHAGNGAGVLADKQRWIATPQTHENARMRCRAIRAANAALQPDVEPLRQASLAERERVVERLRVEAILGSREYAFCLYPAETLRRLMTEA